MSSVGGYSNPLCCLPYVAVITATNVWKKTNYPTQLAKKKKKKWQGQCVHVKANAAYLYVCRTN